MFWNLTCPPFETCLQLFGCIDLQSMAIFCELSLPLRDKWSCFATFGMKTQLELVGSPRLNSIMGDFCMIAILISQRFDLDGQALQCASVVFVWTFATSYHKFTKANLLIIAYNLSIQWSSTAKSNTNSWDKIDFCPFRTK